MKIKEEPVVLRQTIGLCPVCRKEVKAEVLENEDEICLSKCCPEHGKTQDPLAKGNFYKDLEKYYFPLMSINEKRKEGNAELLVTFKCNMDCGVCYLGDFRRQLIDFEPTFEEIENTVKASKDKIFIISGGEATCREDLFDIIRMLKKHKKVVGLNTNGIKLAELEYAWELKNAGIDEVNLQFSGFSPKAEEYLRGKDFLPFKLKALENLKNSGIPTRMNVLIAKGVNDEQIGGIIKYVSENKFIKMVNFGGLLFFGRAINFPKEQYVMPDDMLRLAEEQSGGKIKRKYAYLFKKLELALSSFMDNSNCIYWLGYLVVRCGDKYEPIDKFLDLEAIEPYLDKYRLIYLRNRFLAKIYLVMMGLPIAIFHLRISFVLIDFFLVGISFLFKANYFAKSKRFIYFLFSVECDPYRMDFAIHKNCPHKSMFFFDRVNHEFVKAKEPIIMGPKWMYWE